MRTSDKIYTLLLGLLFLSPSIQAQGLFHQALGGQIQDKAFCIQLTPDGGYVIAGYQISTTTSYDVFLVKLDSTGDTLWSRNYGGNKERILFAIHLTGDTVFADIPTALALGARTFIS